MKTSIHFLSHLIHFFLEWEMFQAKFVEKIKTYILCSITVLKKLCCLWDNVERCCRVMRSMIVWRVHIACWIPKATSTPSEYVLLIAFPLQQWLHECTSTLCYAYIACLFLLFCSKLSFSCLNISICSSLPSCNFSFAAVSFLSCSYSPPHAPSLPPCYAEFESGIISLIFIFCLFS
jgi:hypothetical protein